MAFAPHATIEYPDLRTPIALIIDDPAPCINPLWYFRNQVDGETTPAHEREIPLAFMEAWCNWIEKTKIRGDFTILPYPAGLGRIDSKLDGYDTGELRAWLELARKSVTPQFDIHCEILTHTNALDLKNHTLLPISEHAWSDMQDEAALTEYFAYAMQILGEAHLPNHGLTQPCTYRGDESMYARALLAAEKRVNHRAVTHNFLHVDTVAPFVPPRITYLDSLAGEAVVSVWTGTDDYFWNVQTAGHPDQNETPETLADRFLTPDGVGGRLAALRAGGGPLVLVAHWQTLFANGSRLGLRAMQEVVARVDSLFGEQVAWRKVSELAEQFLAMQTAALTVTADAGAMEVAATCPFDCETLTFSLPTPWPLFTGPQVSIDGQPAMQVSSPRELRAGRWLMRGSVVTVSLPLERNQTSRIAIASQPM